jgi:hypothetical protein
MASSAVPLLADESMKTIRSAATRTTTTSMPPEIAALAKVWAVVASSADSSA